LLHQPRHRERKTAEIRSITRLVDAERVANPDTAIRMRARRLIEDIRSLGPWDGPPFEMEDLASFQSLRVERTFDLRPTQDACVLPGCVMLNVHKPPTRQRYSLAHEIGHTLFPDYEESVRTAGRFYRQHETTESRFERLCQIAASELLFPKEAFEQCLRDAGSGLPAAFRLAEEFAASVEAAARRVAELSPVPHLALVFRPVSGDGRWLNLDGAIGHSPHAPLEVIGAAVSPRLRLKVPSRLRPANGCVADRAWKRVSLAGKKVAIQSNGAEVWPQIDLHTPWHAEAVTLPKGNPIPREVLALLWTTVG